MKDSTDNAYVTALKAQAKWLRADHAQDGAMISHSKALEMVAHRHGARDWNTLRAKAVQQAEQPLQVGDRVAGTYLGQPFTGRVHGVANRGSDGSVQRVTLHFDKAVDVVTFDSFSAFRQRVSGVIRRDGVSISKTSNGQPHLVVAPII